MRSFIQIYARSLLLRPTNRIRACSANACMSVLAATSADTIAGKSMKVPEAMALSSCPPNTVLVGLNYLRGQPPVLAMPDDQYPPWLWDLLNPKVYPDDGPGGKGEKMRLRKANRQRIREQNFLKTQ